jgi:transketolase C-terminal domain/subunit
VTAAVEQQMVATAIALQTRGRIPFAATFADSWTTVHDLIRMAAINGANIRLVGSHAGVAGDTDGTSQQALEDIAMFRAIHNSSVLIAADANSNTSPESPQLVEHLFVSCLAASDLRVALGDTIYTASLCKLPRWW